MSARFWSYCPDEGTQIFATADEARADAERTIGYYREKAATEGWDDEISAVCWGECVVREQAREIAEQTGHLPGCVRIGDYVDCVEECHMREAPGFDVWADYGLVEVPRG